ncbi:MAG TPA: TonB-dependent receptor, partial [Nitrospiraceae bacterium]|nr:TonB-dependent receptor [Nitrospiraceae bacterium]
HEIELSQTFRADTARWSLAWFDSSFRNAIDFESGPPPMLVNRNRVRSRGAELAGWLKAGSQWTLDASVTHARSRVTATGNALRNRPDWNASIGAHWAPTQSLKLSAAAVYTGSSFDSSIATGDVRLPDYLRIDATAVWTFSKRVEAFLAIDNLTGQRYSQFVGFETRGIVPQAGIRLTM